MGGVATARRNAPASARQNAGCGAEGRRGSGARQGFFITATDTGVGKTVLCAALLAAMRAAGEHVRAHKPVLTGLDEPMPSGAARAPDGAAAAPDTGATAPDADAAAWPADDELLAAAAGVDREAVTPLRYGAAASPMHAAEVAGGRIDAVRLLARARAACEGSQSGRRTIAVVEGVGGLLVPFSEDFSVRDLALALAMPVLVAARPGLGTINHTLLTLAAARAVGLDVRAVVLTPWPAHASVLERSNRREIERSGNVEVAVLPRVRGPAPAELARAGQTLPWRRWLLVDAARA